MGCAFTKKTPVKEAPVVQANDSIARANDSIAYIKRETQRLLYMSNGKLTREQAATRAAANYNGAFTYPDRYDAAKWAFTLAVQTDYTPDQVPKAVKPLWQNMQAMKNSNTIIGPALAEFSVRANVFYSYSGMSNTVGLWSSNDGIARITKDTLYTQDFLLLTQAHETLHGIQSATGVDEDFLSWSIGDFQARCLTNEAAAMTVGKLLALEMKDDCLPGPWNALVAEDSQKSAQLLRDFNAAQANNTPYAQALAGVGKTAFYAQLKEQWWLDFYNNRVLRNYIELMTDARLDPPDGSGFTLETARKTGYVSPAFNFTAGLDSLPSSQTMFGTNTRMKLAYDYVDLERLAATLGREDSTYLKKLAQLEAEKNPYLGMDFRLLRRSLDNPVNANVPALNVMNCISGVTPCKDVKGVPFNAQINKIKMR